MRSSVALHLATISILDPLHVDLELSTLVDQRAMVAQFAAKNEKYIIDISPPFLNAGKNTTDWISRLWNSVNSGLIPPVTSVRNNEIESNLDMNDGMQGLNSLQQRLKNYNRN